MAKNDILYKQEKSVLIILLLALLWCVPNLLLALFSRSLVLMSDVPDNLRFILVNFLSWRVLRSIRLGRLRGFDYGTDKLEVLTSAVCSMAYIAALLLLAGLALIKVVKPSAPNTTFTFVGAMLQFVLFLIMGWFWLRNKSLAGKEYSPVMDMQWRLNRADALSSLTCCVSLLLWFLLRDRAWAIYMDPLLALIFVCIAIASFIPKLVAEVNDMLDKTLQEDLQLKIDRSLVEHFDDYEDFHGVRSRRAGGRTFIEIALSFKPTQRIDDVSRVVASMQSTIQRDVPGSELRVVFVPRNEALQSPGPERE